MLTELGTDPIIVNITPNVIADAIFMELAWGDLPVYLDKLKKENSIPEASRIIDNVVNQVFLGIQFLQSESVMVLHRDLHTGNILIQLVQEPSDLLRRNIQPVALITDFGLSIRVSSFEGKEVSDATLFVRTLAEIPLPSPVSVKLRNLRGILTMGTEGPKSMDELLAWWREDVDVPTSIGKEIMGSRKGFPKKWL